MIMISDTIFKTTPISIWLDGVKTQDDSKDGTETDKHSATLTKGTVGASGLWHEIGEF